MVSVAAPTVDELVRRAGRRGRAADLVRGRDPPLPAVLVAVDKVGDDARPRVEGLVGGGEAASLCDEIEVVAILPAAQVQTERLEEWFLESLNLEEWLSRESEPGSDSRESRKVSFCTHIVLGKSTGAFGAPLVIFCP